MFAILLVTIDLTVPELNGKRQMLFRIEEETLDSPFVERIWHTRGERAGSFISQSKVNSMIVLTRYEGKTILTVRGPETKATIIDYQSIGAEFLGITFKVGAYIAHLPPVQLRDQQDVNLPEAGGQSFWLQGSAWQFPTYENVDTFVARLVREGLLVTDPVVASVLQGQSQELSVRSLQYRFLHVTGLTHKTIQQITRARFAYDLLMQGVSILDTVAEAGYADQPHLTRALKRYFGQTPAQMAEFYLLP